jgi:hypothetical protein
MAYKLKRKKRKEKGWYEIFKKGYKEFGKETPQEKRKRYKAKPKYDLTKKIGYPKYAYFYGKERKELLSKMNYWEKKKLKDMEKMIRDVAILSGVIGAGASSMILYKVPTLVLSTPFTTYSSIRLKRMLKERRFFLQEMHKKYYGGK